MQKYIVVAVLVLVTSTVVGLAIPTALTRSTAVSASDEWTPPPSPTPSATPMSTPTASPIATPTALATEVRAPIATILPRFTSTPLPTPSRVPMAVANVPPAPAKDSPVVRLQPPTATESPTPVPTRPRPPTATPTPAWDYVVKSFTAVAVPGARDIAYIRGRLVDRNGHLVPGARFRIRSDGVPTWTTVEPPASRADGTVEFPVTRGRFVVSVVGGRSQEAGWMVTGQTGQDQMTDWEFVFEATH
jgi:hypothetical protein